MRILAQIRDGDVEDGTVFLIGYEIAKDFETGLPMYLGLKTDGEEDIIFIYIDNKEAVIEEMNRQWKHWKTFTLLEEMEEELYYE